jgi:hypothetical protein
MKRLIALVIAAVGVSGCVSQRMNEGLGNLAGQDIGAAVSRLGYPDSKREILGKTIYIWSTSRNEVLPVTTTNTTTAFVGNVPVYGTTTNTEFVPANFNCTIQLATNSSGTIVHWQWSGNMGGCAQYARALVR